MACMIGMFFVNRNIDQFESSCLEASCFHYVRMSCMTCIIGMNVNMSQS